MKYTKFKKHFSAGRISKYALATNNNKSKTVMLYKTNMAVSQAFVPLICVLEVALRNNINLVLTNYFNDSDWIINQKAGFMNDPSLQHQNKRTGDVVDNRYHLKQVNKAENKAIRESRTICSDFIISEQTFGFWSSFYSTHIYKLLRGNHIHVFPYIPSGYGRKAIEGNLSKIRNFRNRISHHEPICFDSANQKDFSEARSIHALIVETLNWIDPDITSFLAEIDYVEVSITRMEARYNSIQ